MKYPAYPKYKDSGVEWLGEIPAEWEIKKLSMLFSAKKGSNAAQLTKEYCATKEGEFPVFSGQTENDGIMALINTYEFDSGRDGFLFSTTVGAKAMSLMHIKGKFSLSQNCMVIIPLLNFIDIRFFYYHMQPLFSFERGLIPEHMQASFRMEDLYAYRIALPPRSTQQSISTFLDTETAKIDGLIKDYEELITLLQEKRQALISHAVTRGLSELVSPDDPEFGEWAKPVKFKNSGVEWLGEIPEDWEVWKVAHVFSTSSGTTPPADEDKWYGGTIPWITTGELREEEIWETEKNITTEAISRFSALKIVSPGCLIIAMYGATIGRLAINRVPATMNQACCALFPTEDISVSYSYYYFQIAKEYLVLLSTGGGQPNISQEKIRGFPIPLPSFPMQQVIASFLDSQILKIDTLISETESAVSLLKEHRSALITNAVTGKINVEALV